MKSALFNQENGQILFILDKIQKQICKQFKILTHKLIQLEEYQDRLQLPQPVQEVKLDHHQLSQQVQEELLDPRQLNQQMQEE